MFCDVGSPFFGSLSGIWWPDTGACLAREASSALWIRWPESPNEGMRFGLKIVDEWDSNSILPILMNDWCKNSLDTHVASCLRGTKTGITSSESSSEAYEKYLWWNWKKKIFIIPLLREIFRMKLWNEVVYLFIYFCVLMIGQLVASLNNLI